MSKSLIEDIRKICQQTGVGLTDAKNALQTYGSFESALQAMQTQGLKKAASRSEKFTQAGIIFSYVHDGRIGVLVEVSCETEFVAKTADFLALVKDLALQIAASRPLYLKIEDYPPAELEATAGILKKQALDNQVPLDKISLVISEQLQKLKAERCLLAQSFNKEPQLTVGQLLQQSIAKLGENIVITRFARLELGRADYEIVTNLAKS